MTGDARRLLVEKLTRYTRHLHGCAVSFGKSPCDCGLVELEAALSSEAEAPRLNARYLHEVADRIIELDGCCAHNWLVAVAKHIKVALRQEAEAPRPHPVLLEIASLVNSYHNDGSTLTAGETLAAIARALGEPMSAEAPRHEELRAAFDAGAHSAMRSEQWCGPGPCPDYDESFADFLSELKAEAPRHEDTVTRFEVIDHRPGKVGRVFAALPCTIELSYQDNGRTLKVFVNEATSGSGDEVQSGSISTDCIRRIAERRSEANTPRSESGPERRSWTERRSALQAPPRPAEAAPVGLRARLLTMADHFENHSVLFGLLRERSPAAVASDLRDAAAALQEREP